MAFLQSSGLMRASALTAVRQVTDCSPSKVYILWDELLLTLVNFPKAFLKELTFYTKAMQIDTRGRRKSVRTKVECYETEQAGKVLILRTHQGFWKKALMYAFEHQLKCEFLDLRTKDLLPLPRLGLMKGFRFSQRDLLSKALEAGCSGTISAPTRYGKSCLLRNIHRAFGPDGKSRPKFHSLHIVPGADLLKQTFDEFKKEFPDRDIKQIGGGSKVKFQSEDLTICSMDSIHKIDPGPVRLLTIDEPHAVIASSRVDKLPAFSMARIYALGATLTGRYDQRDFLLEGLVGPVLAKRTYPEAVAEGAICPIKVMMINWPLPSFAGDRDKAYRELLFENELMGRCARYLSDVVIPREWQMLYFIKTETQADFLSECVGRDVSVAMAKKLTDKERAAMTERVRQNHIKRVICSDIYVQGVTFHEVMVLVNCGGGGASTTTIQKPGRLAEIRPGKNAGLLLDFLFSAPASVPGQKHSCGEGVESMIRESNLRLTAYRDIGYDVHIVERNGIETWFRGQNITPPT